MDAILQAARNANENRQRFADPSTILNTLFQPPHQQQQQQQQQSDAAAPRSFTFAPSPTDPDNARLVDSATQRGLAVVFPQTSPVTAAVAICSPPPSFPSQETEARFVAALITYARTQQPDDFVALMNVANSNNNTTTQQQSHQLVSALANAAKTLWMWPTTRRIRAATNPAVLLWSREDVLIQSQDINPELQQPQCTQWLYNVIAAAEENDKTQQVEEERQRRLENAARMDPFQRLLFEQQEQQLQLQQKQQQQQLQGQTQVNENGSNNNNGVTREALEILVQRLQGLANGSRALGVGDITPTLLADPAAPNRRLLRIAPQQQQQAAAASGSALNDDDDDPQQHHRQHALLDDQGQQEGIDGTELVDDPLEQQEGDEDDDDDDDNAAKVDKNKQQTTTTTHPSAVYASEKDYIRISANKTTYYYLPPANGHSSSDEANPKLGAVLVPGALSAELCRDAAAALRGAPTTNNMRIRTNGGKEPPKTGIVGYYDYLNNPTLTKCRKTAYYREHLQEMDAGVAPFVQRLNQVYREKAPLYFLSQNTACPDGYRLYDTCFSTLTVNDAFRTALHTDSGDYKSGLGVLTVIAGDWRGCYLAIPALGKMFDLKVGDVLMFDTSLEHGNTECYPPLSDSGAPTIVNKNGGKKNSSSNNNNKKKWSRLAVVAYLRTGLQSERCTQEHLARTRALLNINNQVPRPFLRDGNNEVVDISPTNALATALMYQSKNSNDNNSNAMTKHQYAAKVDFSTYNIDAPLPPMYVPKDVEATLNDKQLAALRFAHRRLCTGTGVVLALSMGLGKTLVGLSLAWSWLVGPYRRFRFRLARNTSTWTPMRASTTQPYVLVLTPKSVLNHWHAELCRWQHKGLRFAAVANIRDGAAFDKAVKAAFEEVPVAPKPLTGAAAKSDKSKQQFQQQDAIYRAQIASHATTTIFGTSDLANSSMNDKNSNNNNATVSNALPTIFSTGEAPGLIVVINPEALNRFIQLKPPQPSLILFDEGHRVGNPDSQVVKLIDTHFDQCAGRVVLSGTPLNNDLTELYHTLAWADPMEHTLVPLPQFRQRMAPLDDYLRAGVESEDDDDNDEDESTDNSDTKKNAARAVSLTSSSSSSSSSSSDQREDAAAIHAALAAQRWLMDWVKGRMYRAKVSPGAAVSGTMRMPQLRDFAVVCSWSASQLALMLLLAAAGNRAKARQEKGGARRNRRGDNDDEKSSSSSSEEEDEVVPVVVVKRGRGRPPKNKPPPQPPAAPVQIEAAPPKPPKASSLLGHMVKLFHRVIKNSSNNNNTTIDVVRLLADAFPQRSVASAIEGRPGLLACHPLALCLRRKEDKESDEATRMNSIATDIQAQCSDDVDAVRRVWDLNKQFREELSPTTNTATASSASIENRQQQHQSPDLSFTRHSHKLAVLRHIVSRAAAQGESVVVFTQLIRSRKTVVDSLLALGVAVMEMDGDDDSQTRDETVRGFNRTGRGNGGPPCVIVVSTRVGALGIELVAASTAVLFEPWFNPQTDMQAIARVFRPSQRAEVVTVFRLCVDQTREQRVLLQTQLRKLALFACVVDRTRPDTAAAGQRGMLTSLTPEQCPPVLRDLLVPRASASASSNENAAVCAMLNGIPADVLEWFARWERETPMVSRVLNYSEVDFGGQEEEL